MPHNSTAFPKQNTHSFSQTLETVYNYLHELLSNLDGIMQAAQYHPERDALYHSLQVFECALHETQNPILLAAALFHDVGKGIDYPNHHKVGAQALADVLNNDVCWLIEHHLDLLINPAKTRKQLKGTPQLTNLEKLRRWDLAGRKTGVDVMDIQTALNILHPHSYKILDDSLWI